MKCTASAALDAVRLICVFAIRQDVGVVSREVPLRSGGCFVLELDDLFLAEHYELLPFVRHPRDALKYGDGIEDLSAAVAMRSEEVVIGDPESEVEISILVAVITAGLAVRSLESAVETLDLLLERTELCGDGIIVGKTDDLSDLEREIISVFTLELHGSERIGAVSIGDEAEVLREFIPEVSQSLAHGKDAGPDAAAFGTSVAEDGTLERVHYEPDVARYAADLDVSLVSGKFA